MSLFPAYSDLCKGDSHNITSANWLQNPSFDKDELKKAEQESGVVGSPETESLVVTKRKHKKNHKSKKAKKKKKPEESPAQPMVPNNEHYYVDKNAVRGYLSVETLYRPACPKYSIFVRGIQTKAFFKASSKTYKRYFLAMKKSEKQTKERTLEDVGVDDEKFKKALFEDPTKVSKWLEYYNYKVQNPTEMEKFKNDQIQFDVLEKAMKHNSKDDRIVKPFLNAAKKIYPNDTLLEIIDALLEKDPNNFLLWKSFIYFRQGCMSQCMVPDILQIFEKSMRTCFSLKDDVIMLNLFKYCALFLRGCGLMEQFFGVIHLTINLNITSKQFPSTFYSELHNNQLIEYEELVLKSGLPMNEVWLRIEKLRSAYNFLPVHSNCNASDPQRLLINEDICNFVYPLMNKAYRFDLFILVLRLLKYPLGSTYKSLPIFQNEEWHEQDDVEFVLPVFEQLPLDKSDDESRKIALSIICNQLKDLTCLPSYLASTNLASNSYFQVVLDILVFCCDSFDNQRQNLVPLLLWMRLELILLRVEKLTNENAMLTAEQKKAIRSRVKKTLKKTSFQNNRNFYAEYGLLEYELDGLAAAENVFLASMRQRYQTGDTSETDLYNLCVKYVELAIRENELRKAVIVLVQLANNDLDQLKFDENFEVSDVNKLLALQRIDETTKRRLDAGKDDSLQRLEDYFYPNLLINTLKAKLYLMLLLRKPKGQVFDTLDRALKLFADPQNVYHKFVKARLYEIYIQVIKVKSLASPASGLDNNLFVCGLVQRFLTEFPDNLNALSFCAFSESMPWLRIRSLLTKDTIISPASIIFLIASARYRFTRATIKSTDVMILPASSNIEISESVFKIRILNLLKTVIADRNDTQITQNVLIWRLYLRALFDEQDSLSKCKNALYSGLEVCPWYKCLYLDAAFFTPELLGEMLDIIIEKNLRIHALPEELAILRND